MIEWALKQWANPWIAVGMYWLPLAFCIVGYILRTARNYAKDRRERAAFEADATRYYRPTDTLGDLIGRAVITLLPVGNLFAACFDVAPELFGRFFEWVGRAFSQPLVRVDVLKAERAATSRSGK